jgi:exodeoxyribonuclease VII small subunit
MAKKSTSSPEDPDQTPTFEQLLQRLDLIIQDLEAGQLGLTDSLSRYEEGISHLKRCYHILDQAERRVALITGIQPDGEPIREPIHDDTDSLEDKARKRSERRSHPSGTTPAPNKA